MIANVALAHARASDTISVTPSFSWVSRNEDYIPNRFSGFNQDLEPLKRLLTIEHYGSPS